jgi:CBS domain containing-hemolysin-like protein
MPSPCPGQDPNPVGPAAGTVASIILALVLLAVLLVVCGPLAYKKLVKKCGYQYLSHLPLTTQSLPPAH